MSQQSLLDQYLAICSDGVSKENVERLFQAIDSCTDPAALHKLLEHLITDGFSEQHVLVKRIRNRLNQLTKQKNSKMENLVKRVDVLENKFNQPDTDNNPERSSGPPF